jgi:hypothetical protein
MDLNSIQTRLPTDEDIWESSGHNQPSWEKLTTGSNPANIWRVAYANVETLIVTLPQALDMLYREHRLPTNLGDFSHSLLINAIYLRTQDFQAMKQHQLNSQTTSTIVCQESRPGASSSWFPNTPEMSHWRNSACDCLDVLHWSANSKAAIQYGVEHHTILHLHLSRLILLTPAENIQTFATTSSLLHTGSHTDYIQYIAARDQIIQWVVRDQFKARLCVVHCGALFWHVRRHSCNSIMEPYAVYIATLILWAFSASAQFIGVEAIASYAACQSPPVVTTSPSERTHVSTASDDNNDPSFLHLDRPLDDELVQIFVQSGYKMSAYIMGVGNIQAADAPTKIIDTGIQLLSKSAASKHGIENSVMDPVSPEGRCVWGIEASFRESLKQVAQATKDMIAGEMAFTAVN